MEGRKNNKKELTNLAIIIAITGFILDLLTFKLKNTATPYE